MPERDDHKKISSRRADLLDHVASALAVAERRFCRADQLDYAPWAEWRFCRADQLDYVIRRWLFPIPFEEGTRSMPHKEASIRRSGLSNIGLSKFQDAIGQRLREQYAPERSMPARLANLLREFEQRSNKPEAFARDGYASAV
jgi:hypothetical protein